MDLLCRPGTDEGMGPSGQGVRGGLEAHLTTVCEKNTVSHSEQDLKHTGRIEQPAKWSVVCYSSIPALVAMPSKPYVDIVPTSTYSNLLHKGMFSILDLLVLINVLLCPTFSLQN